MHFSLIRQLPQFHQPQTEEDSHDFMLIQITHLRDIQPTKLIDQGCGGIYSVDYSKDNLIKHN